MARISTSSIGMYAFNAQVVEIQSQTSRNRKVEWYLNGSYYGANTIGTGTTVSPVRTFSNLSAGTYYSITAKIYWSDTGSYITSLSASVTTNSPSPTINTISATTGYNSISVYVSCSYTTSIKVTVNETAKTVNSSSGTFEFTGLTADTAYRIYVTATGNGGTTSNNNNVVYTKSPSVPTLTVSDVGVNSAKVSATANGATSINVICNNTTKTISSYSGTVTFDGLKASTEYSVVANAYNGSVSSGQCSPVYFTTKSDDTVAPTVGQITTTIPEGGYTSQKTFDITVGANDNLNGKGLDRAELYIDNSWKQTLSDLNTTSNTYKEIKFSGVATPTTAKDYKISIIVFDKNNNSTTQNLTIPIYYDATAPVLGDVSASQVATGIKAMAYATDNLGFDCIICQISKPNERTFGSSSTARVEIKSGDSHIFTKDADEKDFAYGSIYYVKFTAKDKANNYSSAKEDFLTFSVSRPADFNWTQAEKNAFTGGGAITVLTYTRWNEFIDNVKAMASWKHNKTDDVYGELSAKMTNTTEGRTLTAVKFNKVKNAIGSMNSTGISDVQKGDIVKGDYFITLSSKLGGITKSTGLGTLNEIHNIDLLYDIGRIEDGIRRK